MTGFVDTLRYRRDHRWARRRIHDYLDDDLTAGGRGRLERHAGICPECGPMLAAFVRLLTGLRALRPASRPAVATAVVGRLRASGRD
jgi:anti-sigma factor RsiW